MSEKNPVRKLSAEVARKIAAGEVIDRPCAIVRELMDNAIDSSASSITVEITSGGIEKIRVVDNGCGMTKDDLENCAFPHSTSKIKSENDLLHLFTLGFRGEALSSIAAVSRLSIVSGGYKMAFKNALERTIEKATELQGTIVLSESLFADFPARRVFLKRPASEALLCKNTFIEKTLAFPEKSFRFVQDNDIKLDLPSQSLKERFVQANEISESASLFYELSYGEMQNASENQDFSFKIIIGEPGVYRQNKKDISIFVNGRKITEYSLVQAIEYGSQGFFPNGTFPVAVAFIQMNPELVDFNIHPAKKEVRFKDSSALHHAISTTVKQFFVDYSKVGVRGKDLGFREESRHCETTLLRAVSSVKDTVISSNAQSPYPLFTSYNISHSAGMTARLASRGGIFSRPTTAQTTTANTTPTIPLTPPAPTMAEKVMQIADNALKAYRGEKMVSSDASTVISSTAQVAPSVLSDFHFLGSALGTFIIVEKDNALYIIDQHAAHERHIFDKIMKNQGARQKLLLPYIVHTKNAAEDAYLESIKDELAKIGFDCENRDGGEWAFTSINERWRGNELELESAILDKKVLPKDLIYSMAAMTACKAAVKDGYILDEDAAKKIALAALSLPDPHCPHGRPVYTVLTRDELFERVRRT